MAVIFGVGAAVLNKILEFKGIEIDPNARMLSKISAILLVVFALLGEIILRPGARYAQSQLKKELRNLQNQNQ